MGSVALDAPGLQVSRDDATRPTVDDDETSSWRATAEVRPTPRELRRLPEVRAARWGAGLLLTTGALLLLALPAGAWADLHDRRRVILLALCAMLALSVILALTVGMSGAGAAFIIGMTALIACGIAVFTPASTAPGKISTGSSTAFIRFW